jgi:hypothetical protein
MIDILTAPANHPAAETTASGHTMTPTAVAVVLLLALVIDYMSVGPDSLRDRIAFLLAVPGWREGFNGSPLDNWTVEQLSSAIGYLLDQTGGAYIAGASINIIIGAGIGLLGIHTVGCLLPTRASKKLGRWAAVSFPKAPIYRINWKLQLAAALLGMMADLGGGLVGHAVDGTVTTLTHLVAPIPGLLFGAA